MVSNVGFRMVDDIGLYIHIPFCKAKCNYCDFNSYPGREPDIEPYFNALDSEISYWSGKLQGIKAGTIFIGGGTPSLVKPELISGLLKSCREKFHIDPDAEISIESNPGTLNPVKLRAYVGAGINRLSIGLQAWQDRLLQELGRIHSRQEFLDNLAAAREAGFSNINIDLIFGLPGQTLEDWTETVDSVAGLHTPHISLYDLKIEEGTVFGDRLEKGLLQEADDDLDREMYHYAVGKLSSLGYRHYEISNFALPGFECRHNLVYWKAQEYLGLGAGAHSYLSGLRFNNVYGIGDYIGKAGSLSDSLWEDITPIDKADSMAEYMMLGFRLTEGISPDKFRHRYGEDMTALYGDKITELVKQGLLVWENGWVKLTAKGLDLANRVFMEFV